MKITDITATALSHRYTDEEQTTFALGRAVKKDLVLVRVETDEGLVGYGEAHHGLTHTAVAEVVNHSLAPLIVGSDPQSVEAIWSRVYKARIQSHGLVTASYLGLSGIDQALWDLLGKAAGQPVYKLLGGEHKPIDAYAGGVSLGFGPVDALVDEVTELRQRYGFKAVKLRLGAGVAADIARVEGVREAFGDDLRIMTDAGTRYDIVDTYALLGALEANQVEWFEEPFPRDDMVSLAELRARSDIAIATGENHYGRADFIPMVNARVADILQPDPSKTGGISELRKIGELAAGAHLRLAPHSSHSPLNHAAAINVLATVASAYIFEADVASNPFIGRLFAEGVTISDGVVHPSDRPGLGIEVDESAMAAFPAVPGPPFQRS